jgi:hypothetical protein
VTFVSRRGPASVAGIEHGRRRHAHLTAALRTLLFRAARLSRNVHRGLAARAEKLDHGARKAGSRRGHAQLSLAFGATLLFAG